VWFEIENGGTLLSYDLDNVWREFLTFTIIVTIPLQDGFFYLFNLFTFKREHPAVLFGDKLNSLLF
jgi:alanine-alpha-ketoisovalerate/valine-pyruvate aminotransferase